jgi:hypothetical protein
MIVTFADLRACRFCSHGARDWFKRHDLDYLSFVQHGLPAETLLATGDAMALRVVEQAKTRGVKDGQS